MVNIELHGIEDFKSNEITDCEELKQLYMDMLTIRRMEEYLEQEYQKGNIRGFCHLVIGQEGLYAVLKALIKNDYIVCSYRCHGAAYSAGIDLKQIICENLGTKDGNARGKGGSMHLYSDKMFGGHGIVGAQVPLGAGLGFALKYKTFVKNQENETFGGDEMNKKKIEFINTETDSVCFSIYGDGASNQGQVYETFNMAKIYNIPVVFIVENNQYGMYTPIENVNVDDCFYKRGYSIPGIRVRDTNISDLMSVIKFAKEYAKKNGPIIVQVDTFRKCGHSTLDQLKLYMKKDVFEREKKLDCLLNLENTLKKYISEDKITEMKDGVHRNVQECIESIDFGSYLGVSDVYTDLFFNQ